MVRFLMVRQLADPAEANSSENFVTIVNFFDLVRAPAASR